MRIKALYTEAKDILQQAGINEISDTYLLMEYSLGISKSQFFVHQDEEVSDEQASRFMELVHKRASRIPLQHLVGSQEFMGFDIHVNKNVLIPRQDTECVVEQAISLLSGKKSAKVLDMCTGSGCIAISIAGNVPDAYVIASDISSEAINVAKENATRNHTDISFTKSNLFEHISGRYDLIISNPPYIRTSVIPTLEPEVAEYEPYIALDGDEDGLTFYRQITADSVSYLEDGGYLIYEIGYDQADDVSIIMSEAGFSDITVKKDLCGLDRCIYGIYSGRLLN